GLRREGGGEGRRRVTDYRRIREAELRYETALGMTPASRMQLRVGDSKARSLDIVAQLAAEKLDDGDTPAGAEGTEPAALPGPDQPLPDEPREEPGKDQDA